MGASSENQNEKLLKTSHNIFICADPNCSDCKVESIEVPKDHDYSMNSEGDEPMESVIDELPDKKESNEVITHFEPSIFQ